MRNVHWLVCIAAVWLVLGAVGFWALLKYENTPGGRGVTPSQWPAEAQIARRTGGPALILFAHPKCPCTRASLNELNRLLARCGGKLTATVLFFQPGARGENWARGALWNSAAAIPGVTVRADSDGTEARRFGAATSGFTVLYDAEGRLQFEGGITPGRGHEGDSAGAQAIASIVGRNGTKVRQAPVFGCGLMGLCRSPGR